MLLRCWHSLRRGYVVSSDRDLRAGNASISRHGDRKAQQRTNLFFDAACNWIKSSDGHIVLPPPFACIFSPQPLRPRNLVGDGTTDQIYVVLAQSLELAVQVLHCGVVSVASGEDVGELPQRHEVAEGCRRHEEFGEQLRLGRWHRERTRVWRY